MLLDTVSVIKLLQTSAMKKLGFPGGAVVKNLSANAGDIGDPGSIPGLGRLSAVENGNPLQHPCLEHSMSRGAWWATVHGVAESRTQLNTHTHTNISGVLKTC